LSSGENGTLDEVEELIMVHNSEATRVPGGMLISMEERKPHEDPKFGPLVVDISQAPIAF
jgi:hypothetical protein